MIKFLKYLSAIAILFTLSGCGIYSFTGSNIDYNKVKTFQVNNFMNNADIVEPGIDRKFTVRLQDLIQNQTNLSLTNTNADLVYEGEIVEFRVTPMTATADQRASQNRLTVAIMVRFTNKKKEDDDFEKRFSFFYDYSGNAILTGGALNDALDIIFERITQDIFNDSLAKW